MSFPRYSKYKDSGVEWLGEVPEHWALDRLKRSTISVKNGVWGDEAQQDSNDIPCVRVADFDRQRLEVVLSDPTVRNVLESDRHGRVLQRGDLLLEKSGGGETQPVGCVVLYNDDLPAVCSNFVARVTVARGMDSSYWRYLHASAYAVRLNTRSIKQTSGIQNLDAGQYLDERACFPPAHEQTAIAAFLDRETAKIDELVSEQQRLMELLKEKRQAVISHAVTKGLNHDALMKPSGVEWLGEVPAHWEVTRLKNLLSAPLMYGANESAELDDPELPRFIRITDIDERGKLRTDTFRSLPSDVAEPYLLQDNDILFARSGATVGKSLIYSSSWGTACFAGYLIRARLEADRCRAQWLSLYSQTAAYWGHVSGSQIQATIQNVSAEKYGDLWVPIPPSQEQDQIIGRLEQVLTELSELSSKAESAIALLHERRSALISAAVTGQIDVRHLAQEAAA